LTDQCAATVRHLAQRFTLSAQLLFSGSGALRLPIVPVSLSRSRSYGDPWQQLGSVKRVPKHRVPTLRAGGRWVSEFRLPLSCGPF
jgi:hypothetical protein